MIRLQSGLLARHDFQDARYPFLTSNWTVTSGLSLLVSSNQLRMFSSNSTLLYVAVHNDITSRTKSFVFSQISHTGSGARNTGSVAHVSSFATSSTINALFANITILRTPPELVRLIEYNPVSNILVSNNVSSKITNTGYGSSIFVDGGNVTAYYREGAITQNITTSNHSAGQVGVIANGISGIHYLWLSVFAAMTDRYIYVNNLPVNHIIELQRQISGVWTTILSSSSSPIDLLTLSYNNLRMRLVIKDDEDTIVDSFEDTSGGLSDGWIVGGDVFYFNSKGVIWFDSFNDRLSEWYDISDTDVSIVPTGGRDGRPALHLSSASKFVTRDINPALDKLFVGFAFKGTSGPIAEFGAKIVADGTIKLLAPNDDLIVDSAISFVTDTWFFIEAEYAPDGDCSITVNGTKVSTSLSGSPSTIGSFTFTGQGYYCDFYISDTENLGNCQVLAIPFGATGNKNEWDGDTLTAIQSPSDDSFLESDVEDAEELYKLDPTNIPTTEIISVKFVGRYKRESHLNLEQVIYGD